MYDNVIRCIRLSYGDRYTVYIISVQTYDVWYDHMFRRPTLHYCNTMYRDIAFLQWYCIFAMLPSIILDIRSLSVLRLGRDWIIAKQDLGLVQDRPTGRPRRD